MDQIPLFQFLEHIIAAFYHKLVEWSIFDEKLDFRVDQAKCRKRGVVKIEQYHIQDLCRDEVNEPSRYTDSSSSSLGCADGMVFDP